MFEEMATERQVVALVSRVLTEFRREIVNDVTKALNSKKVIEKSQASDLLTVREVAAKYRISRESIYKAINGGRLPHLRVPARGGQGKFVIKAEHAENWFKTYAEDNTNIAWVH